MKDQTIQDGHMFAFTVSSLVLLFFCLHQAGARDVFLALIIALCCILGTVITLINTRA